MKVLLIAGARPNFMKIAALYRACPLTVGCRIVHTGQHYDKAMSGNFFDELGIPEPAYNLACGSGTHAEQTARIMTAFEKVCQDERPDLVMVVGDVNSTLACAITAKKLHIAVAHVEAGLRSFDRTMPEEINRIVTDSISDYFFVTEQAGVDNLKAEGHRSGIHFVGDVMIDNLLYFNERVKQRSGEEKPYGFLTLHRPGNVDNRDTLRTIMTTLYEIAEELPIYFPIHPRTAKQIGNLHTNFSDRIIFKLPLSFVESLRLWRDAKVVFTDSGGLQAETTALGVPCITIRETTERPETILEGTNHLAGITREGIIHAYEHICPVFTVPPLYDGKAAERIWETFRG